MEDNFASFHPEASLISRLFVPAWHERCIRLPVEVTAEGRCANCLPHAHQFQYAILLVNLCLNSRIARQSGSRPETGLEEITGDTRSKPYSGPVVEKTFPV